MKTPSLPDWVLALRQWMNRQPKLALAGGAVALSLLAWALYVPSLMSINRARKRWGALETEIAETRGLMEQERRGEVRALPGQEAFPGLLDQAHAQAKKFGVEILSVSPGRGQSPGPGQPVILPVDLQLQGEYRAVGEFLGALRKEPEFGVVTVRHIRIGREEKLLPRLRAQLSVEFALREGAGNGA